MASKTVTITLTEKQLATLCDALNDAVSFIEEEIDHGRWRAAAVKQAEKRADEYDALASLAWRARW